MINQPLTIRKAEQYGKYVSLIPFSEKVSGVTLRGLKYPLTDYTMGGFNSLGISNEIVSDEASISLSSGQLIVIESKDLRFYEMTEKWYERSSSYHKK